MRVVTTSKHPLWHQMPTHTHTHTHTLCDWDFPSLDARCPATFQSQVGTAIMFARCCQQGRVSLHLCDTVLISSLCLHLLSPLPLALSLCSPLCRFSVSLYLCLSLLFSSWTVWLLICLPICAFPIDIWRAFPPAFSTPFPPSNVARLPIPPPHSPLS